MTTREEDGNDPEDPYRHDSESCKCNKIIVRAAGRDMTITYNG